MFSKAFRVFNKRTRRVEENLHVEFLENKVIEKGTGPNWLFNIDSLTKSMNYLPVDAGTKNAASQEVKKYVSSLRYIALPNWVHDALLESSSSKPQDGCNPEVLEGSGNTNPTAFTSNPPATQIETLTVEIPIPTVSSPVPTACLNDSLEPSSDARLISKRIANQEETPSLDNILSLTYRFEDILRVTTSSDEEIGVEADVSNMETTISASPTPTFRIHKDHPKSQIVGPVDISIQTKHKSKEVEEQSCIATIYQKTDPALLQFCLFSCFLSQVEPKKDPVFPAKVYKVEKAMYGLHQAPRAWYGTLSKYLLMNSYAENFEALMHEKFQMSAMGELNFFLGLQVLQKEDVIFLSQDKYIEDILKKFGYSDVRSSNTPMDKENPWRKDGTRKDVDLHLYISMIGSLMYLIASRPDIMSSVCACARHQVTPKESYSDSDYGGASQDHKSTTGQSQYLGRRLILWQCKKQTIVATSTTKAEYVAATSCCGQVLWIQNQLLDYGLVTKGAFYYGLHWDSVVNMCIIFLHGSDSEQRTHEFMHVYLVFASVDVWIGIETMNQETKILATVDGKPRTISESSLRRYLKLNDEEGISSLPDAELFENLSLMGYDILPN
uniref:Reverse transcriptase Ty1/copia-type domain-containing protein n=1 Tax=Tanacetum cinerariifolium TaxID=118510 RepID=A0A699J404_TANCI|nr:hypothetical protein [Tanacetum cinerariifolium]